MKQGQSAVLAPKKQEFYPKAQPDPQLGGEGSGFPPRYLIALGQHNHTLLGIDIGSETMRVCMYDDQQMRYIIEALPVNLARNPEGWSLASLAHVPFTSGHSNTRPPLVQALRTKLGSTWTREVAGETVDAEKLTSILMQYVVKLAALKGMKSMRDAVFTVPASYTSLERRLLKAAAEEQGLNVVHLINEPTAIALAYKGYDPNLPDGNYMIFHMGADTCAATVFSLSNNIIEIKATSAESNLGARTLDDRIVLHLIDKFVQTYKVRPMLDESTLRNLECEAKKFRTDFAMASKCFYQLKGVRARGASGGLHKIDSLGGNVIEGSIERAEYDEAVKPIVERAVGHIQKALVESHLISNEISRLIVCGGATLSPTLTSAIQAASPTGRIEYMQDAMLPSYGAALQACLVCLKTIDVYVWDVLTKPIGIIHDGNETPLIRANTPLPVTAYARLEIVDNTINARLVQGGVFDSKTYTDIVINNCPPCTNGENKVELAVRVGQDGIITYGARHIGLDVALLVTPMQEERRLFAGDIDRLIEGTGPEMAGGRAKRLARMLNCPLYFLPQALRSLGYTAEEIASGRAVELAMHKIKIERKAERRKKTSANDIEPG